MPQLIIDHQSWWRDFTDIPETTQQPWYTGNGPSHVHLKITETDGVPGFPFNEVVSGIKSLKIHVEAFRQPIGTQLVQIHIERPYGRSLAVAQSLPVDVSGSEVWSSDFDCTWDTSGTNPGAKDGWQDTVFRVELLRPDGKKIIVSTQTENDYQNDQPENGAAFKGDIGGAGWMISATENTNYSRAQLHRNDVPELPNVPASWAIKVPTGFPSNTTSRNLFVSLNPSFHSGNQGTVIFNGSLPNQNNVTSMTLDTSGLAPGEHKLFLRATENGASADGESAGVVVIPFIKQ